MTLKYAKRKGGSKKKAGRTPTFPAPAVISGSMPYGYRLRATHEAQKSDHAMPPPWVLDKIAEESVYGPKRDRKNPVCTICFARKTPAGTCFC
jgi:hypothetical protein